MNQRPDNCEAVVSEPNKKKQFKLPDKMKRKLITVGCVAGIALLIFVLSVVFVFLGMNKRPSYALFIKDNALYFSTFRQDSPYRVSTHLTDDPNADLTDLYIANLHRYITLSSNSQYLFFPENAATDETGNFTNFDLFFQKANEDNSGKTKVDTNVSEYYVNSNAMIVTYLKPKSGGLYRYELKPDDRDMIADHVRDFWVTDDGSNVLYITEAGDLFLYTAGKQTEKIDSCVDRVDYVEQNLKTIVYFKEDSLYKRLSGENKEKLDTDVIELLAAYETGEMYYRKGNYPDPESETDGNAAIYYYDGKESRELLTQVTNLTTVSTSPILIAKTAPLSTEDPSQPIAPSIFVISKGQVHSFTGNNANKFLLDPDGKDLYWFEEVGEDLYGDIYTARISEDGLSQPELFDENVFSDHCFITADSEVVYFKNITPGTNPWGDLYFDKELVDTRVLTSGIIYTESLAQICYYTDWNSEDLCGTLKVAKDNNSNKVSDFASFAYLLPNGEILYMYDFNLQRNIGEVYVYRNGSKEKLAEDVSYLIPIT